MSGTLIRYDAMCLAIAAMRGVEDHFWRFPESPGVYVFDRRQETLYVGESRNLCRRLARHERGYLRRSIGVRL
jgi:excinuclease UvrABC nuclease subunit